MVILYIHLHKKSCNCNLNSEEILGPLFDLTEQKAHYYEHVWQPGDLVMWDNLACLHARTNWPDNQTRLLRRCTVEGERLWEEEIANTN